MMSRSYLFLIVFLLVVIAVEWFFPVTPPAITSRGSVAVNLADTSFLVEADRTAEFPPEEAYQSIADRPLFFEGRRPPAPHDPSAEPNKPPATNRTVQPRGKLTGVVVIGDEVYALVSGTRKKQTQRFKVGDTMEGWRVEEIAPDKLVLQNNSERHELPLREFKAVPLPKAQPKKAPNANKKAQQVSAAKRNRAAVLKKKPAEKD